MVAERLHGYVQRKQRREHNIQKLNGAPALVGEHRTQHNELIHLSYLR